MSITHLTQVGRSWHKPTGGFANYEAAKGFALRNPVFTDSLDFPNAFGKLLHLDSILYLRKVSE